MSTKSGSQEQHTGPKTVSDDAVLKIAKEIAVKFIEVGRLTPSTFSDAFKDIHSTIEDTVRKND